MNIVAILLLLALIAWALWRTVQKSRKGGGCCGEHEQVEKKLRAADRSKAHYPYALSLRIGGMTCSNCARKVENALNGMDGVWAKVAIDTHGARVLCKTPPDEAAIREAVRQAGYTVTDYRES